MPMEPNKIEYTLSAELKGSQDAVNALVFSKDGRILVSGGDDGRVRVWNTETLKCEQILYSSRWGQVTTLSWVTAEPSHAEMGGASICVGTGQGGLCLCPMATGSTWFLMKNASALSVFEFNDAVEAQAYDPLNQRLVVTSHSGKIKMYLVEKCLTVTELWSTNLENAIPRGVHFFGGANQNLLIHGLETGEMSCRDAQSSNIMWNKTLTGGIGNATLSPDETLLLVDNLTTGMFDMYHFPASTPSITFPLTSTRHFIKQCVFAEGAKFAVCGSNSGRVHVVDVATGEPTQSLGTDQERGMIQIVAATTVNENTHIIAGGSTSKSPVIYIWHKKLPNRAVTPMDTETDANHPMIKIPRTITKQSLINCAFALLIVLVSYPNWSPFFWKIIALSSVALARGATFIAKFSGGANVDSLATDTLVIAKEVGRVMKEGGNILADVAGDAGVLAGAAEGARALSIPGGVIYL
ncbi:WD40-repeat-containing domain protein [Infundibulicybe gibba]|nr:WD40-repeat-containing domain protein [Infundibulicybe gibba]KAF8897948.1 WD40-repeat-containing domain protein [Infundibulicybe gibba]